MADAISKWLAAAVHAKVRVSKQAEIRLVRPPKME